MSELVIKEREQRGVSFAQVSSWPDRIDSFEDLSFLFSSTILAHGIALLRYDEAAYLYRLVRNTRPRTIIEIGRFRGGGTFLLAAASSDVVVHSYDIEKHYGLSGSELDAELEDALELYGLSDRVHIHVADSRTSALPDEEFDMLFIDGDHSEAGVRADFEHWAPGLAVGGHLLFHDAVDAPDFAPPFVPGPARVVEHLGPEFVRQEGAGSLAHFVRRIECGS